MKRITEVLREKKKMISFEVFPPKKESGFANVKAVTEEIAALAPAFMSVTYGAGGGTSAYTCEIAENIQNRFDLPVIAHLTCVSSSRETVSERLTELENAGITNVMALRGDLPPELAARWEKRDFSYAAELVRMIRGQGYSFCIGGGCYPEGHPECPSKEDDLRHLKEKTDAGCDFLTTQMFFDNEIYYRFLEKCRAIGIEVPILPGIMPITQTSQLHRAAEISGSYLPPSLLACAEKYAGDEASMKAAGLEFAIRQMEDLYANGVINVHVYTMNHPDVAATIRDAVQ